jgi:hypothetical protein
MASATAGASHGRARTTWLSQLQTEMGLLEGPSDQQGPLAAEALRRTEVGPLDEHNAKLLDQVHPHGWENPPTPAAVYNMVAIGGGAGGLVTAAQSAKRGGRVALIERGMLGGDCLNVGCVPSKALLACAHRLRASRAAADFGVRCAGAAGAAAAAGEQLDLELDFEAVMRRMRELRSGIAAADSQQRFTGELGVDLFFGDAKFVSETEVEVGGQRLRFRRACIATGGRASVPPVPGLAETPHHTNATIFNLTTLPERMAIIGAGPIGCELAQAFSVRRQPSLSAVVRSATSCAVEVPDVCVGFVCASCRPSARMSTSTSVGHGCWRAVMRTRHSSCARPWKRAVSRCISTVRWSKSARQPRRRGRRRGRRGAWS